MKQHNQWKVTQLQKHFVHFCLWGFGIVLLLVSFIFHETVNYNLVSIIIGIISFAFGIVMMLFENYLWKNKTVQKILAKVPFFEQYWTPVLEGRWKGELYRDGISHEFVVEITQSFSSVSCVTYSRHSSSSAIASEILFDEQAKIYKLIYYWRGGTTAVQPNTGDSNRFEGFTVLRIVVETGVVKKLDGSYFTDRQPNQTRGTIKLEYQQKELKNSFN